MRPHRILVGVVFILGTLGLPSWPGELSPRLKRALPAAGPGDELPIVVLMDAAPVDGALLDRLRDMKRRERRSFAIARMKQLAQSSQAPVRAVLDALPGGAPESRVLLGINGLALRADPLTIRKLAELPQVRWVLFDSGGGHPDAAPRSGVSAAARAAWRRGNRAAGGGPTGGDTSGPNPAATVRPELTAMGADAVWALGHTGAGVIVAIVDTGFDRTHPDLADHVWTNLDEIPDNGVDDDLNGFIDDTWGWEFCDDHNDPGQGNQHGTQVAGQVAGDGTNGKVTGMAPDAELMALAIDCDTPSIGWAASDYAIAEGAHIISQSYSWWWTDQPDYEAFRRQTDAELAAGVIHVNSAGNHGGSSTYPIPYNISTPANCPAPWRHPEQVAGGVSSMIGVGNIDWFFDTIAFSSSTGPAAWEDIRANTDPAYPHTMPPEYRDYPYANGASPGLIKPDISAYGNSTESTCPGGVYCAFSGTSAAQPKVAGSLALMLSANPEASPALLAEALLTTAEHRGTLGLNNVYGVGLVQALPAVELVQSDILYQSHAIDDTAEGNGDLAADPGERVTLRITVHNVTESTPINDVQAILSSSTPGVELHNHVGFYPLIPALGSAESQAPHFSLSIAPELCATTIEFDLELRYNGQVRSVQFAVQVGEADWVTLLDDDFETDSGWMTDPGTATQGYWVREDPIPVRDFSNRLSNPEDDTTVAPGTHCWVTGNGSSGFFDPNGNDVDGGTVSLTSPAFGSPFLLALDLSYDSWYYDSNISDVDRFDVQLSNDGGSNWVPVDVRNNDFGGWETRSVDLISAVAPTSDMRLRFSATDDPIDGPVDAAVDEVRLRGILAMCDDHVPTVLQSPNPVGDTLRLVPAEGGHLLLEWDAPPVDGAHDPATLYRVDRSAAADAGFAEIGSATATTWVDVDGLAAPSVSYYLVRAENSGGGE
ncbi:MAG: S8 family serine peptidase [bacterium]|nr:S8 family serine peptidase [bacterium]